ncbi:MAG: hypothetical protein LBI31_02975 [Zoogloeaceae bacterium]|nr:hypothetical protein [Zoogloeaceae bacterium]
MGAFPRILCLNPFIRAGFQTYFDPCIDGRIDKLEIIGCALKHLDVSNTQVKEQNVRVPEGGKLSGHVTVTGSNIKPCPKECVSLANSDLRTGIM